MNELWSTQSAMSHETCVIKPHGARIDNARDSLGSVAGAVGMMLASGLALMLLLFAATTASAREQSKLVVLGDSLVAGYGLQPGESFPDQLQKALDEKGIAITVENAGVSGDTSTGGLARLDWSVGEDADIVLVELGANDALRGIPPEVTRANLEAIITRLEERGIAVMLAGMLAPPNMGAEYEAEFNPIYGELAQEHGVALYPFFLDGVAADPELNQSDGIHPTAEGIAVMVERFMPFFEENYQGVAD